MGIPDSYEPTHDLSFDQETNAEAPLLEREPEVVFVPVDLMREVIRTLRNASRVAMGEGGTLPDSWGRCDRMANSVQDSIAGQRAHPRSKVDTFFEQFEVNLRRGRAVPNASASNNEKHGDADIAPLRSIIDRVDPGDVLREGESLYQLDPDGLNLWSGRFDANNQNDPAFALAMAEFVEALSPGRVERLLDRLEIAEQDATAYQWLVKHPDHASRLFEIGDRQHLSRRALNDMISDYVREHSDRIDAERGQDWSDEIEHGTPRKRSGPRM